MTLHPLLQLVHSLLYNWDLTIVTTHWYLEPTIIAQTTCNYVRVHQMMIEDYSKSFNEGLIDPYIVAIVHSKA